MLYYILLVIPVYKYFVLKHTYVPKPTYLYNMGNHMCVREYLTYVCVELHVYV